jgi:hypothetical protein
MEKVVIDLSKNPKLSYVGDIVRFDAVVRNETGTVVPVEELLDKVNLHLSDEQMSSGIIGRILLENLPKKIKLLTAVVLDWLMNNQKYIPESWKGKYTFFAGTVFLKDGVEVIRGIYYGAYGWATCYRWLDRGFYIDSPLAVVNQE